MAAQPEAVRIAVVHGPNLNLLGQREPEVYGRATLAEVDRRARGARAGAGGGGRSFQANGEGALVDHVQRRGRRSTASW